jgi:hypothetical protein
MMKENNFYPFLKSCYVIIMDLLYPIEYDLCKLRVILFVSQTSRKINQDQEKIMPDRSIFTTDFECASIT